MNGNPYGYPPPPPPQQQQPLQQYPQYQQQQQQPQSQQYQQHQYYQQQPSNEAMNPSAPPTTNISNYPNNQYGGMRHEPSIGSIESQQFHRQSLTNQQQQPTSSHEDSYGRHQTAPKQPYDQQWQQQQQQAYYQQQNAAQQYPQQANINSNAPYGGYPQPQPPVHNANPATVSSTTTHLPTPIAPAIAQSLATPPPGAPISLLGQSTMALGLDHLYSTATLNPDNPAEASLAAPFAPALTGLSPSLDPAYSRCTLTKVPRTSGLLSKSKIPFGLVVTPYPRSVTDQVPMVAGPIVRCRRCRTYLNPYVEMIEAVPPNYDYDSTTNVQIPREKRPELSSAVYDFLAPAEYMVRPPQPAIYLFLLDVSSAAISSGLLGTVARTIKDGLDAIPDGNGRSRIGFICHDSALAFFRFTSPRSPPTMLVVPDLGEASTMPAPEDELLVPISEYRGAIEALLDRMTVGVGLFRPIAGGPSALGPALTASIRLLSRIGGKIVLCQTSLPSVGEGSITPRQDAERLLGTAKEFSLLQPTSSFYKGLATECSRSQVCIDMFLAPAAATTSPIDVASLGCASKYTGGAIYYYPGFNATRGDDALRLAADLGRFLALEPGLEAVVRIRASHGLSLPTYHGSFFLRSTDLLALPNVNPDHSYTANVSIDETITSPVICFQTAVLHTSCSGERRIRVINMALPTTTVLQEVLNGADQGALLDVLAKMAVDKILSDGLEAAREALQGKLVEILTTIRQTFHSAHEGHLLITENLRLLPLLILAAIKSPLMRGGTMISADERVFLLNLAKTLSPKETLLFVHPAMFSDGCVDPTTGSLHYPPLLNLSGERLERTGMYLLDNGLELFLWIGSECPAGLVDMVLGPDARASQSQSTSLPYLENAYSARIHAIVEARRSKQIGGIRSHPAIGVRIVWDAPPGPSTGNTTTASNRSAFVAQLVEDRGAVDGQPSLAQWLNLIREKVNK